MYAALWRRLPGRWPLKSLAVRRCWRWPSSRCCSPWSSRGSSLGCRSPTSPWKTRSPSERPSGSSSSTTTTASSSTSSSTSPSSAPSRSSGATTRSPPDGRARLRRGAAVAGSGHPEAAGVCVADGPGGGRPGARPRRLPRPPGHRGGVRRRSSAARPSCCTARPAWSSTTARACSPGCPTRSPRRATTRSPSSRRRIPDELEVTARTASGVVMALRHRERRRRGRAVPPRVGAHRGRPPDCSPTGWASAATRDAVGPLRRPRARRPPRQLSCGLRRSGAGWRRARGRRAASWTTAQVRWSDGARCARRRRWWRRRLGHGDR